MESAGQALVRQALLPVIQMRRSVTMAQAAIDLPDPLNNSGPVGPGVDDLLAQLAGEEIDRLLAEADVERPARAVEVIVPSASIDLAESPSAATPPQNIAPTVNPLTPAPANHVILAPSASDPEQSETHFE